MGLAARLLLVLLVANLGLGGWFHSRWRTMEAYQQSSKAEIDRVRAQNSALQQVIGDVPDLKAEIAAEQQRVKAAQVYTAGRLETMPLLNDIAFIGRQTGATVVGYNIGPPTPYVEGLLQNALALEVRTPNADAYIRFLQTLQDRIPGLRPMVANLPGEPRELNRTFSTVIYSREGVVRP